MHSDSIPHGLSSVALQLQRGISARSAVKIWTFPMGRFTCEGAAGKVNLSPRRSNHPTSFGGQKKMDLDVFIGRRLPVVLFVLLQLAKLLLRL